MFFILIFVVVGGKDHNQNQNMWRGIELHGLQKETRRNTWFRCVKISRFPKAFQQKGG